MVPKARQRDYHDLTLRHGVSAAQHFVLLVFSKVWLTASARHGFDVITAVFAYFALVAASSLLHAQPESSEPATPPSVASPLPDILGQGTLQPKARLFLSDRNGSLVLVTEETAEEYFRSRGKLPNGEQGLPPAVIERVNVEVRVSGEIAYIASQFDAVLAQDFATAINLEFGSVQWNSWDFAGEPAQHRIQPLRNSTGWRWLALGKPDSKVVAKLQGVSKVTSELERRTARFTLPTAACSIALELPLNATDIRVRNEDVLERLDSSDSVKLLVRSTGGDFTISWREQESVAQVAAVHATSDTQFEIVDPTHPWMATTTLNIRWYGEDAADEIEIRLPEGGHWRKIPNSDPGRYLIFSSDENTIDVNQPELAVEIAPNAVPNQPEAVKLTLRNLNIARNETIEIDLDWEWAPNPKLADGLVTEVQVPSPTIGGVDRHSGTIDCVVTSAYAVVFKEGDGARLLRQGLLDAYARQQVQFEFDRQPFDVTVIFRSEESLPTVRPTYLVHVDRNKLTMTMWFDCSFETDQPQLELILDEWVILENSARVVNDANSLFSNSGEVLRVQQQVNRNYLIRNSNWDLSNYANKRHVDQIWRVVAERAWTPADKELYFQVPQIIRGSINGNSAKDHGSGAMLVTSEANVLLDWLETAGTGLQRDSFSTEYEFFLPASDRGIRKPLVYHFQSSETTPRWAGKADLLPRQISLAQLVDLNANDSQLTISQNFELQVANEPIDRLKFAVRKDANFEQATINGNLVTTRMVEVLPEPDLRSSLFNGASAEHSSGGNSSMEWQVYEIQGGPDLLGVSNITITSSIVWRRSDKPVETSDAQESQPDVPIALNLPLAALLLPSDSRRTRHEWSLVTNPYVEIVSDTESGLLPETLLSTVRVHEFSAQQLELPLVLKLRQWQESDDLRINKSWLQTFVNGSKRRDRFVAQVVTSASEINVRLPAETNILEVQVSVNGYNQDCGIDQRLGVLKIPLIGKATERQVVEISYFLPDSLFWTTRLDVTPPQIIGAVQDDQFFWQLITPAVQHLALGPSELTAEWTWQWSGMWWERKSSLGQKQLEEWIATDYQEPPPASANSYVMSGRGQTRFTSVWVLSRFVLWFPVGILAIAVSFLALNFPAVRRPIAVYATAVIIAGLSTIWPDIAVLAGQTAVLSLGLVALVWVIQAAVDSRVRRRSVFSARPSTYIDRSDPVSFARAPRASSPAIQAESASSANGG